MHNPDISTYRDILSDISDAVFLTDSDGKFKFICPNVSFIFGYSHEEVEKLENIDSLIGSEYKEALMNSNDPAILKNWPQTVVDQSGKLHHLLINFKKSSLLGADLLITCRDITETKLARDQAELERDRHEMISDTIPDMVLYVSEKGKILDCNLAAENMILRSRQEIIGASIWEIGPMVKSEAGFREFSSKIPSGESILLESEILATDNSTTPVEIKATAFENDGVRHFVGIVRDISRRVSSELKLREFINGVPDAIYSIDEEGVIDDLNEAATIMTGYDRSELIGKSIASIDINREGKTFKERTANFKKNQTYRFKTEHVTKDEEILPVEVTIRVYQLGDIQRFFAVVRDLSVEVKLSQIIDDSQEIAKMGSWYLDLTTNKETWSKQMFKLYGLDPNLPPPPYSDLDELFTQQSRESLSAIDESLEQHKSFDLELEMTEHAPIGWMRIQGEAVENDKGEIIGVKGYAQDITEIKKKDHSFREVIRQAPYGIALVADDGTPYLVNESLTSMLGYSDSELEKMPFKDFTHPDDFEKDFSQYARLVKGEIDSYSMEKRYLHKKGHVIPASMKVTLIDDSLSPTGKRALAMVEDLSEKKQKQEELEKYFRFFNIAKDNFCIASSDGTIIEMNPQFPETLGYPKNQLIGSNFLDLIHPDDIQSTLEEMSSLDDGLQTINFRNRYRTQAGNYLDLEWISVPLDGLYYAVARDITESLAAQEKIAKAEALYKTMQEAAPYPIQMLDKDGVITYVNKQTLDLWGFNDVEELVGRPITDIDTKLSLDQVKEIIEGLEPHKAVQFETVQRHSDGTMIPVEMRSIGIPYQDDLLIYGMGRDLRPQIEAERKLRVTNDILLESQKMAKLGSWRLDVNRDELIWSDEIYNIFGERPGSFEGTVEAFYSFVHPEEVDKVRDYFNKCVAERKHYHITHRIVTKYGEIKHVREDADFEYDDELDLILAHGTVQDVTESELYQRELQINDENLQKFFKNVHVGIVKGSMNADLIEINPEFERITGYSLEELNQMDYWSVTPEKYKSAEEDVLAELLDKGRYGPYQKEYIRKDGTLIPAVHHGVMIKDSDGNEFIWSVVQDVSDEEKAKEALRQDVEKFKVLLDTGRLIAFEVTLENGQLRTIRDPHNIEHESFPLESIANFEDFIKLIRKEHREVCLNKLKLMKSREIDNFSCQFQISKGDRFFWHEGIISILETDGIGTITKVFVTLRNIEAEKNQEIERIKSQEKERLRIARDIHDSIGQMLVGTRLTLQTQIGKYEGLEEIDSLLDEMIKESRMIINNFGISLQEYSLKDAFESLAQKMGRVFKGDIHVDWKGVENIEDLKLSTYIFRIYQEALSNAIKYSGASSIHIKVKSNSHLRLEMIDNGKGFDMQTVNKGFGIFNMQERANEIGYRLEITSKIDKGTKIQLMADL